MHPLHLGVNDVPSTPAALCYGLQQAMLCISSLLVYPLIVSDVVCAGAAAVQLRVQLIAATFVTCGLATILQTTFGLRLSTLQGPAMAFLPPLLAYQSQHSCPYGPLDEVPPELWHSRFQEIQGSLLLACVTFVVAGSTGLAGLLSKLVGPCTIVPLMLLLTTSIVPTVEAKLSLHWISLVMLACIILMAFYLENTRVSIPYFSFSKRSSMTITVRLFGQFPYLLSIATVWFICWLLTISDVEPVGGEARTDKNMTVKMIRESPWVQLPLPGAFGRFRLLPGLCAAYVASCFASVIENIGSYELLARTSCQKPPPKNSVNRAIIFEGLGSMLAALLGVCTGVTTYAENIALMHITKVASRRTMQFAGVILVFLGLFTKIAAILAAIPDALVGGVLCVGVSMIGGVALSNLQLVDLKVTRNLSVMGLAFVLGLVVPLHFEKNPLKTGSKDLDDVLSMLLSIKMLVGGVIGVILDNTVPGATRDQRGFQATKFNEVDSDFDDDCGYRLPGSVNRLLSAIPALRYLPFLPSNIEPKEKMEKLSIA
ncbi:unnamed protein product [Caenorhabditis auriculariae]|uniref:Uncharacterized protein n=1 Tax=Caenorhabditis auriculariae TaxID=2777116 RepID=A0A8S1HL60_9PELO|nr:unnamed protein product [Caenorhabditis auriculariae]